MKKVLFLLLAFSFAYLANAQCDVTEYTNKCAERLKPDGFKYLKSYKLDFMNGSKKQIIYSYVFSNNTSYRITLANGNNKGLFVTLMDSEKKPVASSYLEKEKKYMPAIDIKCSRTGIYYLAYEVKEGKDYCGSSVIGFKR
ncbi:hypothetical protein [Raineya orbicola]|jgi:hypothetical protein|uniref:Uncharacterized protein n=1 Tax=Raineya orbicola TaxID=2016530 RepID=A0A2N3IK56_9BACT|nr:hypothetical protein [Raineya orbicola]PKQ70722.1 hypothetical protein Rain11_0259 [Raineya orbicola]